MKKQIVHLPFIFIWEKLWYYLSVLSAFICIYFINVNPFSPDQTFNSNFPVWVIGLVFINGIVLHLYLKSAKKE